LFAKVLIVPLVDKCVIMGIMLYTISQLKDKIPVHRNTILNWVKKGDLKAIKIGKLWFIDEADLNKILRGNNEPTNM